MVKKEFLETIRGLVIQNKLISALEKLHEYTKDEKLLDEIAQLKSRVNGAEKDFNSNRINISKKIKELGRVKKEILRVAREEISVMPTIIKKKPSIDSFQNELKLAVIKVKVMEMLLVNSELALSFSECLKRTKLPKQQNRNHVRLFLMELSEYGLLVEQNGKDGKILGKVQLNKKGEKVLLVSTNT